MPRIANRYEVLEKLGEGGMGIVYRAFDRLTGQSIALKQVTAASERLQFKTITNRSIDFRVALAQEFRTLASMRHPNIISVLAYGFTGDQQPFFTMELLTGQKNILSAGRDQPLRIQVDLIIQILQALVYLHRRGIIHRDMKPDNAQVIHGKDNQYLVKLLDFGLALSRDQVTSGQDTVVGTLSYMAPEILTNQTVSEATDLFAVGVIAYELLAGRHPFNLGDINSLLADIFAAKADFDVLRKAIGDETVAPRLTGIIARLMERNVEDRYRDASSVIADLNAAFGQSTQETVAIRESFLQAARFVGRSTELNLLTTSLDQVISAVASTDRDFSSAGQRIWLVGGESGIGKSRLLDEIRVQALVRGMVVLVGQGVSGGGIPYQLWREPLRHLLIATEIEDADATVLKEIVPDIAALIGHEVSDAPALESKLHQQRLAQAVYALFRAQTQPILLIMEDLHWASESLEILKRLIDGINDLPLMLLGSYRNDERPSLPDDLPQAHVIPLLRLNSEEVAQLSASMLGAAGEQPHLVDMLDRETEGNIFFLVETVRLLAEDAGQLSDVGRITLPGNVFAGGMRAVVQQRLERVPQWAMPLLQKAAVSGRWLDLRVIGAFTDQLDTWLNVCADCVVLEWYDNRWRFTHDKLREGLLEQIPHEILKTMHRDVALAIEKVYPNDPDRAAVLAEHWKIAENPERERHFARLAAQQATKIDDYRAAERFYDRLFEITPQGDHHTLAGIMVETARVKSILNRFEETQKLLNQGMEYARQTNQPGLIVEALHLSAHMSEIQPDYPTAVGYLRAALEIAPSVDVALHARTLGSLATILVRLDEKEQATAYIQQAYTLAQTTNDRILISNILNNRGVIAYYTGRHDETRQILLESLPIYRELMDKRSISKALGNLGVMLWISGDFADAKRYLQEAMQINYELGDQWHFSSDQNTLGYVLTELGELDEARHHFKLALPTALRVGAISLVLDILAGIAQLMEKTGDYERATELLGLALAHPSSNMDVKMTVDPIVERFRAHLTPEQLEAALERGKALDLNAVAAQML